ncbi:DUF2141 domain-containing protein [Sphingomonas sp. PB2P19]|uniref:DUF2141 domain-containing protein n=1 Tax=Sphingomonas rhamnosi TaxID=3096156 RepID=UPI002FC94869
MPYSNFARTLLAGALILSPGVAVAQTCVGTPRNGAVKLAVEATTLQNRTGEVAFTIYPDDKGRFLSKGGKLTRARVSATDPRACFWLAPGYYAIAQYHDENGDHKFNRTLFLPKEGYGFSNDAPTAVGLPSFAATRFQLPANGRVVRMKMRYGR